MKSKRIIALVLLCFVCLAGCAEAAPKVRTCHVVLEEGPGFESDRYTRVVKAGQDAVFTLRPKEGYTIREADYGNYTLTAGTGGVVTLTLHNVRYSESVSLTAVPSDVTLSYHANGGARLDGGNPEEPTEIPVIPSHLRLNTSTGIGLFTRSGYTLLGWNTAPDGSGEAVGLGSRVTPEAGLVLYAQWVKWTEESLFHWERVGNCAAITGYTGHGDILCVPAALGGLPVEIIRAGAFENAACEILILPHTLRTIENGAFKGAAAEKLWLSDSLQTVSDYSFAGCEKLRTLHINAVEAPVYAGTYYATFPDKFDRLLKLAPQRKIVLFSGSSTRFGYDSQMIDEAFPDYAVVNMGVFAYTNAAPQLELILTCMGQGDILIHAPEFDAAQRQFCTNHRLDAPFFNMVEGNYDLAAALDLRQYSGVFEALQEYLTARRDMERRSYGLSPSDYDEDGNPVDTPSYNAYGDYIPYRPNGQSPEPIYGLPVNYTVMAYPKAMYLVPLNEMYGRFLERGVRVYFTYAPRNCLAISEDSTYEARQELDRYFRENLSIPVLGTLEESLWSGIYLHGTDNHLSTEGVAIRTERIIGQLKAQLEQEAEHE